MSWLAHLLDLVPADLFLLGEWARLRPAHLHVHRMALDLRRRPRGGLLLQLADLLGVVLADLFPVRPVLVTHGL